jgi:predicted Zn-dependent protease
MSKSAHQRLIALSQSTLPISQTITHLLSYLDTFYSDPSAWSLLADLYADQGMYAQSLSALGHVMVLQTWDNAAVRKSGEVAYTLGYAFPPWPDLW